MNKRILDELSEMLSVIYTDWLGKKPPTTFQEYALPIVAYNLALRYTPEEVAIFVRDRQVKALFKLYISTEGPLQ